MDSGLGRLAGSLLCDLFLPFLKPVGADLDITAAGAGAYQIRPQSVAGVADPADAPGGHAHNHGTGMPRQVSGFGTED